MATYSQENAQRNLEILSENPYPGRLLVVGFAGDTAIQAYAVEGRSEGSRNRVLVLEDNVVSTEVFDTSLPTGDPELTIYDAMRRRGSVHIVSNGKQTNTAIQYLRSGKIFADAMKAEEYEPDEPNCTPRITGYVNMNPGEEESKIGISVIRKAAASKLAIREFWSDHLAARTGSYDPTLGYAVHTYKGDGKPLPSFDEAPFPIPLEDSAEGMAQLLWQSLDQENRVAVAAKTITPDGEVNFSIINAHEQ